MQSILDFGVHLIVGLQGLGTWLSIPMQFFTFLGTEEFFILVLPILYWCVDSALGLRVAVILMLSGGINTALKLAFHGPRPYWYSTSVHQLSTETSFGVPSGHAQDAAVVWGVVAAYFKKSWGWLAAILIIFFIGLSRLYLGVHFPHDVLVGWLIGGLILWLALRFWNPVAAWVKKLSAWNQVLTAFLFSLGLFIISLIPYVWLKATNWQPPQAWASFATQAMSLQDAGTSAGTFFGLMAGLIWLTRRGGFKTQGFWWQFILRYLLGVVGILILYALKYILPDGESAVALIVRYLRYGLIGFWVTGGAPWAFIRLKLAGKS